MIIYGFDCETTGLSPFEHEVITVQYADAEGDLTIYRRWEHDSELGLLEAFLRDWSTIQRKRDAGGALFVGFNLLKFDVPFVFTKCLMHDGLRSRLGWTKQDCWKQLYRWPMYLDLVHLVGADFISMDAIREVLLGTTAPTNSRDIPILYADGRYDRIDAYVEDEMAALLAIYNELQRTPLFTELMAFRRRAGHDRALW